MLGVYTYCHFNTCYLLFLCIVLFKDILLSFKGCHLVLNSKIQLYNFGHISSIYSENFKWNHAGYSIIFR